MEKKRDFSTKNADYTLHYGIHFFKSKINDLKNYDAIVLETGFNSYDEFTYQSLRNTPQYQDILKKNEKLDEPRPIFFVDVPPIKPLRKY